MGPLDGVRVIELAAMGPVPFACMMFADLGAEVIRVDRLPAEDEDAAPAPATDVMGRSRRSISIDLKRPEGVQLVLDLVTSADVLVEGFRPGVMERLGLGPAVCAARNRGLVYARMTGWGQAGPFAGAAGHDINYIALAGALHPIGPRGAPPTPPLAYVGDFGGGGMLLAVGVLAALQERNTSKQGQIVDAAMVDGAALLTAFVHGARAAGEWCDDRVSNVLDGGAPFYGTYETADGGFVSVGPIEPRFYTEFLERVGVAEADLPLQYDRSEWDSTRQQFANVFRTRTRQEWCDALEGTDACFAPVLAPSEAPGHPHLQARQTFLEVGGVIQPAPAPRFSRTPAAHPSPPPQPGQDTEAALLRCGIPPADIERLRAVGVIGPLKGRSE